MTSVDRQQIQKNLRCLYNWKTNPTKKRHVIFPRALDEETQIEKYFKQFIMLITYRKKWRSLESRIHERCSIKELLNDIKIQYDIHTNINCYLLVSIDNKIKSILTPLDCVIKDINSESIQLISLIIRE